ncbi:MAG: hypothetical protein CMJ81_00750 [Planctomycetaceae bacterium]|nr:hypothetical protein [Planctomycetaceae bacterium]MBP60634.1 hypothetical protein [Planctomycetaceae bacterium]
MASESTTDWDCILPANGTQCKASCEFSVLQKALFELLIALVNLDYHSVYTFFQLDLPFFLDTKLTGLFSFEVFYRDHDVTASCC